MNKPPFNVRIVDPKEYITKWGLLPVTNHAIYESSSTRFHPDGFFSEVIFGPIGSNERLVKKGYIDLHTTVITPHIYKQLLTLKNYYQDILSGRVYAYFDEEMHDFVKTTKDDPNGKTGYSFFISHLKDIEFPETGSNIRHMKIELLHKYSDRLLMRQLIVIPAGMRDARNDDGQVKSEDINKIYFSLLSLSKAMPDDDSEESPLFDTIRYQIQNKVQQVFQYIANLFDGKGGFAQSKYAARSVVWGARNVITAPPIDRITSADSPAMLKSDEAEVPLFQAIKECQPLLINKLNTIFFNQIFTSQSLQIPLIQASTQKLQMHSISQDTLQLFTTADGITELSNKFREASFQMKPITVPIEDDTTDTYYLYMVYDAGDTIYFTRNTEEFCSLYKKEFQYDVDKIPSIKDITYNNNDYVITGDAALAIYGMDITVNTCTIEVSDKLYDTIKSTLTKQNDAEYDPHGICIKHGNFNMLNTDAYQLSNYRIAAAKTLLQYYEYETTPLESKRKIKFLKSIIPDTSLFRPMTYAEMFYIAAYSALQGKCCTATRYPVLNLQGISTFKIHVSTTEPSRSVVLKDVNNRIHDGIVLPNYPKMDEPIKASMSMHPCSLGNFDGKCDCHH